MPDLARLLDEPVVFPVFGVAAVGVEKEGAATHRGKPLPEDYALRGLRWSKSYFPEGWFVTNERIDDEDKYFELPSMLKERRARLVWLGCRIVESGAGKWLRLEEVEDGRKRFAVSLEFDVDLSLNRLKRVCEGWEAA